MQHYDYLVFVQDRVTGIGVTYRVLAVDDRHAIQQGKDSFTGYLGDIEAAQARLHVEASRIG